MPTYSFPAHYRFFHQWVERNLLRPTTFGDYELPAWRSSIGWFSAVDISNETDVVPSTAEKQADIDYCAPMGTLTVRTYTGFMDRHHILVMSVRGIRPQGYRHSDAWAVSTVGYVRNNPRVSSPEWVFRELMARTFTRPGGLA